MAAKKKYSRKLFDKICDGIALGLSVAKACEPHNLDPGTFHRWFFREIDPSEYEYMCQKYAKAKDSRADAQFETILDVAFDDSNDYRLVKTKDGEQLVANHGRLKRAMIKIDALKWHAGKSAHGRYGDKLQHNFAVGEFASIFETIDGETAKLHGGKDGATEETES